MKLRKELNDAARLRLREVPGVHIQAPPHPVPYDDITWLRGISPVAAFTKGSPRRIHTSGEIRLWRKPTQTRIIHK